MARRPRIEIEGGLYHVIARGNDRQDIFHSAEDHLKFLSTAAKKNAAIDSQKKTQDRRDQKELEDYQNRKKP